jgi:hypothetical protein
VTHEHLERNPPSPDTAALLAGLPEVLTRQHLSVACLNTLRTAVRDLSPTRDPHRWAAMHLVLGSALRVRGQRMGRHDQAEHYREAIVAFESAACVYCQFDPSDDGVSASGAEAKSDPVDLVLSASTKRISEATRLLQKAACALRAELDSVDRRTHLRRWAIQVSNLGCTLTLLGRRTDDDDGTAHLEEAVDAFREVLREPGVREMTPEYASVHVNLADALQALGERAMPAERVQYFERAADSLAVALSRVAPEKMRWMLEIPSSGVV